MPNQHVLSKIESELSKSIAHIYAALKMSERLGNSKLTLMLQKQLNELTNSSVAISEMMDTFSKLDASEFGFQVGDTVQVVYPYNSYHLWIGKIDSINLKKQTVTVAFPNSTNKQVFPKQKVTKQWASSSRRLMTRG